MNYLLAHKHIIRGEMSMESEKVILNADEMNTESVNEATMYNGSVCKTKF